MVSLDLATEGSQKWPITTFSTSPLYLPLTTSSKQDFFDLTDDSWYAIMKDLEERQRYNLGWRTRCRGTMQEERGGCIPGCLWQGISKCRI